MNLSELESEILKRSFTLRATPRRSRRIIRAAVAEWQTTRDPDQLTRTERNAWRARTFDRLNGGKEVRYGNPIILWLIGVAISMLWQWWLVRDKKTRQDDVFYCIDDFHTKEGFAP
jgi:hypothetical protein